MSSNVQLDTWLEPPRLNVCGRFRFTAGFARLGAFDPAPPPRFEEEEEEEEEEEDEEEEDRFDAEADLPPFLPLPRVPAIPPPRPLPLPLPRPLPLPSLPFPALLLD